MEFLIGLNVKPKEINNLNEVLFENAAGASAIPTESECKAYGFIWSKAVCYYQYNDTQMLPDTEILSIGRRNSIEENVLDSSVIGIDNSVFRNSNNNLIVGDSNTLNSISNTLISGTKGDALYNNSQILGGNQNDDILGERQSILLLAGADTTNSTYTRTYINDDGSTLFNVEDNSIVAYTAHTIAVRTGGSASGANGDFKYWIERGAVVSRNGTLTLSRTRDTIASDGTHTGWNVNSDIDGTNFFVEVKGKNNIDLKWIVRMEISEMRTGIDLS